MTAAAAAASGSIRRPRGPACRRQIPFSFPLLTRRHPPLPLLLLFCHRHSPSSSYFSACDLVPPSRAELSPFVRRRKPFSTPGEGEGRGTSGSSLTSSPRAGNIRKQLGKIKRVDAGKWRADPLLDPPLSLSLFCPYPVTRSTGFSLRYEP